MPRIGSRFCLWMVWGGFGYDVFTVHTWYDTCLLLFLPIRKMSVIEVFDEKFLKGTPTV